MALVGVELETLVYEPDALTTRPLPCPILLVLFLFPVSKFFTQSEKLFEMIFVLAYCIFRNF